MEHGERTYERIVSFVAESAWAMHPVALAVIGAVIAERRAGHRPSDTEIRQRIERARDLRQDLDLPPPGIPEPPPTGVDSVAVIPIDGAIVPKADLFTEMSGGTSIVGVQHQLRAALDDPAVSAIVLNVDSPGGSVDLVPELATEIMQARGQKPLVAVANTWAASAAYWIASAAEELVVTPSGQVGSIGVYSMHEDFSVQLAMNGVDVSLISAGQYKVEGNPFEPLDDEAHAEIQRMVDAYYSMFLGAVARQRGVSVAAVEANFGQGRMVLAADAVEAGMADRIATLEETVDRLAAGDGGRSSKPAVELRDRLAFYQSLRREERRPAELRDRLRPHIRETTQGPIVEGFACAYDIAYTVTDHLGEYEEIVSRGAATKTLLEKPDVRYLVNHEGVPLGRTVAGTLQLSQRDEGLWYETAPLDMANPKAQEIVSAIGRGDVDGSSFAFRVTKQEWNASYTKRTVNEFSLHDGDVSSVTFPANPRATSGLRAQDLVERLATVELEELVLAARGRDDLTGAIAMTTGRLQEVLEELTGNRSRGGRDTPRTLSIEKALRDLEILELTG